MVSDINDDETETVPEIEPSLLRDIQADLEESLLGGPRRYTRVEIAEFAGVSVERADRLWVSMGYAVDKDPHGVMFTEGDIEALRTIASLVDRGIISPDREVAAARALGQSMSRLAEWQVSLISTHIVEQLAGSTESDPHAIRRQVRELTADILPAVESLQAYVWRRHIASTTGRNVGNPGEEVASRTLVVGFADIVGYTSLTRQLGARDLADLLERFESASASVIGGHHGWVVKTVGDEVMFAVESPSDAADIAFTLQEQVLPDEGDPNLRVGLAMGPALVRFGDLYGSVVNTAARLTSSARPGTVLIDDELAGALADTPGCYLKQLRPRRVRGIRRLEQYVLRRDRAG
ncbi:adenylate/guanylate cyclase domain-containing protein [Rhodococcus tibetensis]|uniref:Adenylate/guanylate cyclase domain-containing protein n=1 Tax=Rhodococcus tibetensis TaxID=2965064 RepID=A0ABT1QIL5_9NOCA|nr:adenylate/guanylate cyclase domain-containing protein [Rhodococcus sp. FXJ9.536]MCQ4122136.1 adenylate/guanylate cyclase domain-containing protein [Rhodococcus sp. FXJ9.536]